MQYRYHKPHRLLSKYVKTVLTLEGSVPEGDNNLPLFTNGMPALVCRTSKSPTGTENTLQLTLFGSSVPPYMSVTEKNETLIFYFFTPYSLACLFNLPASLLAKHPSDLATWNAHKTNAIKTQLYYAATTDGKINVLDSLLLHQLEEQREECEIIHHATDHIMFNSGKEVLSLMLKELNVNERTFQRMFKKFVGVTPGQYRRICQFKASFEQVRGNRFEKLSDVGYNAGFADQSHFIRSFKEFTDITPKRYSKSGLKKK